MHARHPTKVKAVNRLLYGMDEAADVTSLSKRKLYQLISSGELASVKVGKRRLIRAADLDVFVQSLTDRTPDAA